MPINLLSLLLIPAIAAQLTPSSTYSPPNPTAGLTPSTETPNQQWVTVLGNSLWFYDAQRSGKLDDGTYGNRVVWRNDSALEDGSDVGLDLSGGWYDAGDYIKATFPLGFTLFGIAWGALTHGEGYDAAGQTAYLDGTLRWGMDWLMKAHPSDDVLYVQIGSTDVDNDYWGGDQNIPTPRPSYPINSLSPGTDALASTAAAFAISALLYNSTSYNATSPSSPPTNPALFNSTYAALLLDHAERAYIAANTTLPYTTYTQSVPAVASAYGSSSYGDDLAMAALSLALATNQSHYYADAYYFYQTYKLTGSQAVWNWDSRTPALYVIFVEAALARPGLAMGAGLDTNLTGWRTETEAYFDRIVTQQLKKGYLTKGGLLYYDGDSDDASLNPAIAAAVLMLKYAPMASSEDKGNTYVAFAQAQVDYLMGNNPMNVPYMVGIHPNSPQNPHSAMAAGGDNVTNIRSDPPVEAHVLYGAMVGGPLANDKFWDYRDDWVQNEVALDYNAMLPSLAAMQILNGTQSPYYTQIQGTNTYTQPSGQPCDAALPCDTGGLSKGAIAGIAIGVILGLGLLIFGLCYWKREGIRGWWQRGYSTRTRK